MLFTGISVDAQFNVLPPNLMIHDSLGNERPVDFAFQEGYDAALFYYWASWCPPCRATIEDLRPYAQSWEDDYNTKIVLIVYDRDMTSDSLLSLRYWRDNDLEEVGDLYFVKKDVADAAHFEVTPGLTPWSKNYLHRASDGRLIAQIGSSVETMDSILNQFFGTVNSLEPAEDFDNLNILQDDQEIHLLLGEDSELSAFQLYDLSGQMIRSNPIDPFQAEAHISKLGLLRNQVYILSLTGQKKNSVLKLYVN